MNRGTEEMADVQQMTYSEMRRRAKTLGLKNTGKAEKLRHALLEHYSSQGDEPMPVLDEATENGKDLFAEQNVVHSPKCQADSLPDEVDKAKGVQASFADNLRSGILAEIDHRVSLKVLPSPNRIQIGKVTPKQIQPVTPASLTGGKDWQRIHGVQFDRMESLPEYMERKAQRKKALGSTTKTPMRRIQGKEHTKGSEIASPPILRSRIPVSKATRQPPAPSRKAQRCLRLPSREPEGKTKTPVTASRVPWKPSITSVSKVTFRFGQTWSAPGTAEPKKGSAKEVPAGAGGTSVPPKRKKAMSQNAALEDEQGMCPFNFAGTSSSAPPKKAIFDLKASLAQPLTYQPHRGKLKPWMDVKENVASKKQSNIERHRAAYKQPKLQGRVLRKEMQEDARREKKDRALMARRGLDNN
uniref:nucleolar and spindle-associated protein 1-like n=1 Tax=Myxine glutinosa TaxID=7769 RepID=UPI00359026C8